MRLLDLCCGEWGWSRAFAARGWECVGVDLVRPTKIPQLCEFVCEDILFLPDIMGPVWMEQFDFAVASTPCEEFSVWGMKHFHPKPPYPETGIRLFNYARSLLEDSGVPYVMENVRPAQQFVGQAQHHCGPFYLWGTAVPPLVNQGIKKNLNMGRDPVTGKRTPHLGRRSSYNSKARARDKAITATIPPELANCVAEYAERLLEQPTASSSDGASSKLDQR